MSDKSKSQSKGNKGWSDSYKMVILRSEDFQEVRSFNLTMGNIYVISSTLLLILCGLLFSLMAFTPLKRLIPGYGKIESNQEFLQLVEGVDQISTQIDQQEVYLSGLRTLLSSTQGKEGSGTQQIENSPVTTESQSSVAGQAPIASEPVNEIVPNQEQNPRVWSEILDKKLFNPVTGIVSSDFDPSIKHFGVDILAPAKSPVLAITDGFIFSSGWDLETGYTIGIQHDGNILSFYKHNSQLLKEKGTFVAAGEAVAIIGNTGTLSTGPHLHFELWHNGKPINPKDVLNFK